jgi:amidase
MHEASRLRPPGKVSIIMQQQRRDRKFALAKSQWSFGTAIELSAALTAKKVSAIELTEHAISRIERYEDKINAICVRDFDRALAAARAADAALARGETRPLLGVPMTVKESYHVAGLPTTWGIPERKNFVPAEDALSISRVKDAGCVILGKTNVPLTLGDWQSFNEIYGTTNNPYDLARTPGGSSGGSAAALAAGYGPLSLGSDIGGSLRVPAFHCGVYAHKPTWALVPLRGHTPPPFPALPIDRDLTVIGPMARCAADLSLLLDVIAGPDPLEAGKAYIARIAVRAARRLEGFPRAGDRYRSGNADGFGRAWLDRQARRQSRQGRRQGRTHQSAVAEFCGDVAALYADADVVPRRFLRAGNLCWRQRSLGSAAGQ